MFIVDLFNRLDIHILQGDVAFSFEGMITV